eukprot:4051871-Amphidinium_carterae.1
MDAMLPPRQHLLVKRKHTNVISAHHKTCALWQTNVLGPNSCKTPSPPTFGRVKQSMQMLAEPRFGARLGMRY